VVAESYQVIFTVLLSNEVCFSSRILNHPKVGELSKKIDIVNPKREDTPRKGGPDLFEI
jgi:hypothetical protein